MVVRSDRGAPSRDRPPSEDETIGARSIDTPPSPAVDPLSQTGIAVEPAIDPLSETRVSVEPVVDPLSKTGVSRERPRSRARGTDELEIGASIGRYVVVDFLGAGGMGAVYAAYDPELDRKVALKVLLRETAGGAEQRKRLVREAQALARLQHPNVVAVHDVGEHDGRVFLAMEFVRGATLGKWLASERAKADVVRVFADAARGLGAAHALGMVHRDFKPDNVMIDEHGRVRVMDFGLARTAEGAATEAELVEPSASSSMLEVQLSTTGTVVGTPAYMAPEQFGGKDVDARSDQFSYCVALFEAFAGSRPFGGGSVPELAANVIKGNVRESAAAGLPGDIRRIAMRGLSVDPNARFATMDELVAELVRDRGRSLRIAGLGLAVVGVTSAAMAWTRAAADRTCDGGQEAMDAVWTADRRTAIAAAFDATALPYAETAKTAALAKLAGFASEYADAHRSACEATEVRHEQSAELLDARMRCLARRLDDFTATVEVLERADAAMVERAHVVTGGLPALEPCSDPEYVVAKVPPPTDPEARARVDVVQSALARARAQRLAGRFADASVTIDGVVDEVGSLDHPPLSLELAFERAELANDEGKPAIAVPGYERVFFEAREAGLDELRSHAALELVYLHGYVLNAPVVGRQWARHAGAELDIVGTVHDRSMLLTRLASLERRAGDTATAKALLLDALRIEEQDAGPDALPVAQILNNLCTVSNDRGDPEAAERYCRRGLEIRIARLGADHPRVAETLNNIGGIQYGRGETEAALESFRGSAEIVKRSLGEESPAYARALNNLGAIEQARGEKDEARAYYERALAIYTKALGPDHPDVGMVTHNLGIVAPTPEEQLALYERALAIREAALGPEHLDVAETLNNLGEALQSLDEHTRALASFERSRAIFAKKADPNSPRLAMCDFAIGSALARLGRTDEAIVAYERALPNIHRGDPIAAGRLEFGLAKILPAKDEARARDLAKRARETLAKHPTEAKKLAEVDAWLAGAR